MHKPGKTLLVGALRACVASPLFAQRQHGDGFVGEPLDVSNWLHPADGSSNGFVTNCNGLVTCFENQPSGHGTVPLSPADRADFTAFLANAILNPRVANEPPPVDRPKARPLRSVSLGRGRDPALPVVS